MLAISQDDLSSHQAFAEKLGGVRSFPHLADPPMNVIRAYGVVNDRGNGARRSVFVVDREGMLRYINPALNINEPAQYQELLDAVTRIP